MNASVQLQVQVPAGSPEEAAAYINALLGQIEGELNFACTPLADDEGERTVAGALAYFRGAWKERRDFMMAVHEGLVGLRFEPRLPDSRPESRNKYPYIRYLFPDGATLGSINSGSFAFSGKQLQESLANEPGSQVTRDGVRFQLGSEDAVRLVISLAETLLHD